MYAELGEEDVLYGLWKRRCVTEDTRLALGQLQHGFLEEAQNTLLDALAKDWKAGEAHTSASTAFTVPEPQCSEGFAPGVGHQPFFRASFCNGRALSAQL